MSTARLAAWAAILAALSPPVPTSAAPVEIAWAQELAAEHDRQHYDRELRETVASSLELASTALGLRPAGPLRGAVLTTAAYEARCGSEAAFTDGACYEAGTVFANGASRFGDRLSGIVVHAMAHAVLDYRGTANRLPMWLNEGLAERLSWRRQGLDDLAPNQREGVRSTARELVPLPTWGANLRFTYLQCYAAALFLERRVGRDKLLAVVRRTLDGESFERALDQETRLTPADLEREFVAWAEHLQP